jgi:hypothetical protein
MAHEDQTKHLEAFVSFDPAIDRDGMGANFDLHFGVFGAPETARLGTRDPALIKILPGKRACKFTLRPLTLSERFDCDSVTSPEHRLVRALGYALVKVELHQPLSYAPMGLTAQHHPPMFTLEMLDQVMEFVGVEAVYEIGAVAYTRSRLGPFGARFAPLLLTSAQRQVTLLLHHADTLAQKRSATPTTAQPSPADPPAQAKSGEPGGATAPASVTAPPEATPSPTG